MSVSGSEYSVTHDNYESRRKALLGVTVTNNEAESVLGGITSNVQRYGRIHLSSASAVSDTKRNKFLSRGKGSKDGESSLGLFHNLDDVIREAIVLVALKDAPKTCKRHSDELESHTRACCIREELIRERNDKKMTEDYIDAFYYHKMYNSDACNKSSPRVINRELKKLTSEAAKYTAIKENIRMRDKGLGWDWCEHAWSKNGTKYTVFELAKHLQMIIKKEKSLVIPNKPPLIAPARVSLPVFGTQSSQVNICLMNLTSDEKKSKLVRSGKTGVRVLCILSCSRSVDRN
jgi:hypothetical protein